MFAKPELSSPPAFIFIVSVSPSESKTTGRLKIKLEEALLFWIGWVTPVPVTVSFELFIAVMVNESAEVFPLFLIWATVLSLSTIRSASMVILAVSPVGIPKDQLAALDHRLSFPALVKVEIKTEEV